MHFFILSKFISLNRYTRGKLTHRSPPKFKSNYCFDNYSPLPPKMLVPLLRKRLKRGFVRCMKYHLSNTIISDAFTSSSNVTLLNLRKGLVKMTFPSHLQYLNGSLSKLLRSLKVYFRTVRGIIFVCVDGKICHVVYSSPILSVSSRLPTRTFKSVVL